MRQIFFIPEYIAQDPRPISYFNETYPTLRFQNIDPGIFLVTVPEGEEVAFSQFTGDVASVDIPTLYGLNATEALQASNISFFHEYPFGELRGRGVLLGIVDTGIDYTNSLFQYEDNTTRIVSLWDQTIEGDPPEGINYGTEYSEEQINEALASEDPLSVVPSTDTIGHGTFIAGVSGGNDRSGETFYRGGAPDSEFIVVKLKPAPEVFKQQVFVAPDVVAYESTDLLTGVVYLKNKAIELDRPLALCIAVGGNVGYHDGSAIIERYLEQLSYRTRLNMVIAAGNEANAAHHYERDIVEGERKIVELNIAEGEKGVFIQVWTANVDKVSVGLISPIGQVIDKIPLEPYEEEEVQFTLQETEVRIIYSYPNPNTGAMLAVIQIKKPIGGIWRINIYGDYILEGIFNMWLNRVGFIKPDTRFLEPYAATTLSVPGTARGTISVGGYNHTDGSIYAASSRGPTKAKMVKPDLLAPGVGIVGPGTNGSMIAYTGTGAAAAITVSACALLLEWGILEGNMPNMNTRISRIILARGAERRAEGNYPNNIEGYGTLNLRNSFALI